MCNLDIYKIQNEIIRFDTHETISEVTRNLDDKNYTKIYIRISMRNI